MSIIEEINQLKAARNAIILAHNYTLPEIQDIADFTGDSLELSRKAAECKAPVIVFCGVSFMAETAKILSPESIVLNPVPDAGCEMADMVNAAQIQKYRKANPNTTVVAYVNTTADTKTAVDVCCTSGNAEKLIGTLPKDGKVLFVPDANLGANINGKLGRSMELWKGCCPIHDRITVADIEAARKAHPGALVMVHPECRPEVVAAADAALSTGAMLKYVREQNSDEFIVGTESGIIHRLEKENPTKRFHALSPEPVCQNMKKIKLVNVLEALRNLAPRVELDAETISAARRPIDRMLEVLP